MDSRSAFPDSNATRNVSSTGCPAPPYTPVHQLITEDGVVLPGDSALPALQLLSDNLASVFESHCDFDFYADAKILVSADQEVAVHRCILAARNPFFNSLFASYRDREPEQLMDTIGLGANCGSARTFQLKHLARDFDVGYHALVAVLSYLYSGKARPFPRDACICVDHDCLHVGCLPAVDLLLQALYLSFTFQIPELVTLYQRRLLEIVDNISPDDLLLVLYVANLCTSACDSLQTRCVELIAESDVDTIALEKSFPANVVELIVGARTDLGLIQLECNIHVKRIYRALDSNDVELVTMLLKDGHTTLNDSHALHYAVAYCDSKTTTELLKLGLADVNCKNQRGFSVLHVAAMRKEPTIIASLLTKGGAHPTDVTRDGRKALQISKRLTKASDWHKPLEKGKSSHTDRLCIEILEQAERTEPMFLGEDSVTVGKAGDDLQRCLLHLESRVGLAKLLFPEEAKVAMQIAQVRGTTEFSLTKGTVYSNESPFIIKEEHHQRRMALEITVKLGKHWFPRCSEKLDLLVEDEDLEELANMGNDTPEQIRKKQKFMDIQDIVHKAFNEDKEARATMKHVHSRRPMSGKKEGRKRKT